MGMGSPTPVALSNGEGIDATLTRLVESQGFKRLDGYQNSVVKLWAPQLYATYRETVEKLYKKLPHLERSRNFRKSIFAAAAFNFGRRVRMFFHWDHMNWPFGLCTITALGHFDPERSRHLILKPFKMVINFPHASTVAIPSACITHSNASIAPGDLRMSFTQYMAGAIFCWVENGFQTEQAIKTSDFPRWQEIQNHKKTAVGCRLELYSVVSEILQDTEPIL
ncbi:hypothetical protein L218DRAFT_967412 [Marasmius fiardii PR-910]|nr:hypothetical protein L218DRAFT_967412 [Marasmius fiardii PR-910]